MTLFLPIVLFITEGINTSCQIRKPLKLELAYFIECIINGEEVRSGGDFSAKIVSVLEASDHSLASVVNFIHRFIIPF